MIFTYYYRFPLTISHLITYRPVKYIIPIIYFSKTWFLYGLPCSSYCTPGSCCVPVFDSTTCSPSPFKRFMLFISICLSIPLIWAKLLPDSSTLDVVLLRPLFPANSNFSLISLLEWVRFSITSPPCWINNASSKYQWNIGKFQIPSFT